MWENAQISSEFLEWKTFLSNILLVRIAAHEIRKKYVLGHVLDNDILKGDLRGFLTTFDARGGFTILSTKYFWQK